MRRALLVVLVFVVSGCASLDLWNREARSSRAAGDRIRRGIAASIDSARRDSIARARR